MRKITPIMLALLVSGHLFAFGADAVTGLAQAEAPAADLGVARGVSRDAERR